MKMLFSTVTEFHRRFLQHKFQHQRKNKNFWVGIFISQCHFKRKLKAWELNYWQCHSNIGLRTDLKQNEIWGLIAIATLWRSIWSHFREGAFTAPATQATKTSRSPSKFVFRTQISVSKLNCALYVREGKGALTLMSAHFLMGWDYHFH